MPADNAVLVSDYIEEPKYAAEVPQQQPGPGELNNTDAARKLHAAADPTATVAAAATGVDKSTTAAPAGPVSDSSSDDGGRGGLPIGSGKGQVLSVGMGVGTSAAGGGGGGVGGQVQQQGAGQDARHLDAIFSPPSHTS